MKYSTEDPAMLAKGFRRVRKPNYTREETEILLDQLLTYGNYLFGKTQPGINNQQRADVWANIASMVNAVPNGAGRTVEELKHRWQDLAQRARAALRKSSGDKQQLLQKQMPYLDKVLRIMGEVRPDTIPSKGSHSPALSTDTSDADTSTKIEIKQEKVEPCKESPVILNQTVNPLKRMLTPLKTPSLKRFREGKNYDSSTMASLPSYNQNGMSSLVTSVHPPFDRGVVQDSLENPVLPADVEDQKHSSIYFTPQRHSEPRSMVMDPESQLIMEVDLMDEESRRSPSAEANNANEIYDKTPVPAEADFSNVSENTHVNAPNSVPENGKFKCNDVRGDPHAQRMRAKLKSSTAASYGHSYNCQPCQTSDETTNLWEVSHLETMSTHQLERLSLISKIRLHNQQTSYVKLKEEKLRLEVELLKTKHLSSMLKGAGTALGHPFFPHSVPHTSGDCFHASDVTQSSAMEFEVADEGKHHTETEEDNEGDEKSREETCVEDGEENENGHESSSSETEHDCEEDHEEKEIENHRTGDVEVTDNGLSPDQNGEKD